MPEPASAHCQRRLLDVNKAAGQAANRIEISMTGNLHLPAEQIHLRGLLITLDQQAHNG